MISRDAYSKEKGAYLYFAVVKGVEVKEADDEVEALLREAEEGARARLTLESLKEDPKVRAYRKFMWDMGIDPTKVRPSSEALARRALRGRLPRINSLVDLGNAISLKYLVPIGIYDLDNVVGNMTLRRAERGEPFEPIGSDPFELKGIEIVLADEKGPMHLFPYRDSRRTMVTLNTKNALVAGAGVPGVPEEDVEKAVEEIVKFLERRGAEVGEVGRTP
ncbi:B3/4 domain-containing protein [Ignicoccus hospitalis]|uniref:Phosphoenolpyruvate synthase n=1 Tax=Ignicoccus hospitalis (strain KIN4/I / DSM 18386 / JCM 14125) TaxID=453591 RepID=A8A9C5_IGNH4|nr:phenylalanine--tRNA ligase beta subunit-related protein [Ignicoccus hospitalis]ABU81527.1 phosphoenolpyruvate synthase [Ignicoccus hospitalis KIN4/I]HIH90462.1 hypothetical protein [Desulfurococcaceae archaeon]